MEVLDVAAKSLLRIRGNELERHTRAGVLFTHADGILRCSACAHRCVIEDGSAGACRIRIRRGDELRVPFGYVARRYTRPVETNTVFHVRPGGSALTFGMYGCDLHCPYCQNYRVSQALRDVDAGGPIHPTSAAALVAEAVEANCSVLCAAYNEPLITAEWAHAVFSAARARGLTTALITDGHSTPEAIEYMRPVTDVFRVDLKGFDDAQYRALGGRLRPVLDSIAFAKSLGYWVEVVTLVVPGFNDDPRGLRRLGDVIHDVDASIPWHLDAFQPRYRMRDRPAMGAAALFSLAGSAYARGLSFVYVGNVPNSSLADTRCPECHTTVIERENWKCVKVRLEAGRCRNCSFLLPGLW
jgi:pyruvate formate lyase activating enzyme